MTRFVRPSHVAVLLAVALFAGCGGPDIIPPPPPTQSVQAYWVGIEESGALHFHVTWNQSGRNLTLRAPCEADKCILLPVNARGVTATGSGFPVAIVSGTGTITDPGVTFTMKLENGREFSFTGRVQESMLMAGKVSGATFPESGITFEKRSQ